MQPTLVDSLSGIIAVIRTDTARAAIALALGLEGTPVGSVEVTMTVPDAVEVVRDLNARLQLPVGVGTVTEAAMVEPAVAAGAAFLVSPGLDTEVVGAALATGVPVMAGALTPTEILAAWKTGATAVKVFPVSSVGGPDYVRMVRAPLPHVPLVVSGGDRPGGSLRLSGGRGGGGLAGIVAGRGRSDRLRGHRGDPSTGHGAADLKPGASSARLRPGDYVVYTT